MDPMNPQKAAEDVEATAGVAAGASKNARLEALAVADDAAAAAATSAERPPAAGVAAAASGVDDTRSQKERMLAGDLYYAFEPQLTEERREARRLLHAFNGETDEARRLDVLRRLLGGFDEAHPPFIEPPFRCDYVSLLFVGVRVLVLVVVLLCASLYARESAGKSLSAVQTAARARAPRAPPHHHPHPQTNPSKHDTNPRGTTSPWGATSTPTSIWSCSTARKSP